MKGVINVDLDGVLYDFIKVMRREYLINGFEVPEEYDPYQSAHAQWNSTRAHFVELMETSIMEHRLFGPGLGATIHPGPTVVRQLQDDGWFVRIVTAKSGFPPRIREQALRNTLAWIEEDDIPYDDIAFVSGDKLDYRADVVIDDRPIFDGWAQKGAKNILFTQPHNDRLTDDELASWNRMWNEGRPVYRAFAWTGVYRLINEADFLADTLKVRFRF